ncbi:Neurotransmitter-gated ion-channel ligand binding domain protein [Oesophagostomum dentatum]|uniref:Neurotransmitter-gated ion-channel ligand binding domain protein n=1 Tax=Oesophagostomum dentatum TaxID=61180 RepID=A0A0B1SM54_OESDE|nr:Neurotransmitter-gated ion-channel ligand binding domain protein [Oesophagostomum dentatum]
MGRVSLQQIIDVDEKNQIVYVNAWLDYTWYDYKLSWDLSEYGNITDVRFPAGKIWKPDVLLYNSVDANFDSTYQTNMVVYNDGKVHWVPPGIFKISCKINIEWFPFDEQQCKFKVLPYLTLLLEQRFNLIMPCILTTLMTLLGFTLPPDAGEKITLQITVLLSICFFLGIVSDMSPPTSEAVPLLGVFFSCCMIVVTASTVFTVYVLNLHYRTPETHEMSAMTRSILLYWLPWILRMKRPGVKLTYASLPSLFSTKLKSHSESLIRNIKENEASISRSNSFEIERRLHFYMSASGIMNGVSPPLTEVQSSQVSNSSRNLVLM